jgi:hypothetical protein
MKLSNIFIVLFISTAFHGISQNIFGTYESDCYEKLILRADSTFYYAYSVHHGTNWAVGTWKIKINEVILTTIPILDTVDTTFELVLEGTDSVFNMAETKKLKKPYTVISRDTLIDNYDITTAEVMSIACCGGQLIDFQQGFRLVKNELYKLKQQVYPECTKLKKLIVSHSK